MRAQTAAGAHRSVAQSAVYPDSSVRRQRVGDRSGVGCRRDSVRSARLQPRPWPTLLPSHGAVDHQRQLASTGSAADAVAPRWLLTAVDTRIHFIRCFTLLSAVWEFEPVFYWVCILPPWQSHINIAVTIQRYTFNSLLLHNTVSTHDEQDF